MPAPRPDAPAAAAPTTGANWRDPTAFAALVARHQPVVMGLGQTLGLFGPDLDDAAADAFAAVYSGLPKFDGRSDVGTWVYRIAYRTLVKARTRGRRHRGRHGAIIGDVAAPAVALADRDTAAAVWAAVAELDPRQATAVELHYRQGQSMDGIAAVLGCPVGTVKTLLFRARQRLRTLLVEREVYP